MRIAFLSDLHIDVNNVQDEIVNDLKEILSELKVDKLFVAGDTFNNYRKTISFFDYMNSVIDTDIHFVFGNHEYWTNGLTLEKSSENLSDWYLHNKVVNLNDDVVVIGSNGWFDLSFIQELSNPYIDNIITKDTYELYSIGKSVFDLSRLKINEEHKVAYELIYNQTKKLFEENKDKEIIFVTHFVPHEDFLVYKDNTWNSCNAFMGSKHTHELLKEYNVTHCSFGHTHKRFGSKIIEDITYHVNPIGYRDYDNSWSSNDLKSELLKSITVLDFD